MSEETDGCFSISDWNELVDQDRQFSPLPEERIVKGTLGKNLTEEQLSKLKKGAIPAVFPGARWFQVYESQTLILGTITGECVYRVTVDESSEPVQLLDYKFDDQFEELHKGELITVEGQNFLEDLIDYFLSDPTDHKHPNRGDR